MIMTTNIHLPAFAIPDGYVNDGLTKREMGALMIAQGLVGKYTIKSPEDQITIARMSIELTETIFSELEK